MDITKPSANRQPKSDQYTAKNASMLAKVLSLVSPSSNSLNFDSVTNMHVPMGPSLRGPLLPDVLFGKLQIDIFDAGFCEAIFFGIRREQLQRLHPGLPCTLPIARLAGELGVLHQRVKLLLLGERHSWSNRSPRRMEKPGIKLDWKRRFSHRELALRPSEE